MPLIVNKISGKRVPCFPLILLVLSQSKDGYILDYIPDYSNPVWLKRETTYTVPSDGLFLSDFASRNQNSSWAAYPINGITFAIGPRHSSIPVLKGDIVNTNQFDSCAFIPYIKVKRNIN